MIILYYAYYYFHPQEELSYYFSLFYQIIAYIREDSTNLVLELRHLINLEIIQHDALTS